MPVLSAIRLRFRPSVEPSAMRAHDAVAELLLHFQRDLGVGDLQRVVHLRHCVAREFDVDDGADDLHNLALAHVRIL